MEEQIPTFLCDGESITEVLFTGWTETAPDAWTLTTGIDKLDINGNVTRIVYELPIGCFEQPIDLRAGDTITFRAGGGGKDEHVTRCRMPHGFEREAAVAQATGVVTEAHWTAWSFKGKEA